MVALVYKSTSSSGRHHSRPSHSSIVAGLVPDLHLRPDSILISASELDSWPRVQLASITCEGVEAGAILKPERAGLLLLNQGL